VDLLPQPGQQKPVDIGRNAVDHARKQFFDVVLVDTAGRLHVDAEMMAEIQALHAAIEPVEPCSWSMP
jgi:signal recognition particle subunit SRP54